MESTRSRLSLAAAFLCSAILLAASPEPRAAQSDGCGGYNGKLCTTNESCLSIIFYKQCTTKYTYYPGGDTSAPGDPLKYYQAP